VDRVGQEQEAGGEAGRLGDGQAGLAAAVGVPAQPPGTSGVIADDVHGPAQARAVALGVAARGRPASPLAEGQVDPERRHPPLGERLGEGHEERGAAVAACPVREHETAAGVAARPVQDTAHGRVEIGAIDRLGCRAAQLRRAAASGPRRRR
jgi:hypothetical protein